MLKLIKNLLAGEVEEDFSSENTSILPTSPDSTESIIANADELWQNGKLGEALVLYRQAIKQNPESTEVYDHICALLKQQGDVAQAYEKLAAELKQQGKIEQAADYYRQAIGIKTLTGDTKEKLLKPNFGKTKNNLSPIINLKDNAFSFQLLDKTSSLVPKTNQKTSFQSNNQDIQLSLNRISQEQAQNVKWETAQVYLQQALEHCKQKQWAEAVSTVQEAIDIKPDLAEAYKIKGNALQRMGKTAAAMECYIKAVEIKPNLAEVYGGIGDVYAKQQQWDTAIEYYRKAIIIKPSVPIYLKLADIFKQIGELEEAKIYADKASQLESESGKISRSSSLESEQTSASSNVQQQESSINSDIKAAENPQINNPKIETYRQIAEQLEQQNRWQEATVYYRQALKLSMSQASKQLSPAKNLNLLSSSVDKNLSVIQSTEDRIDKAIKSYQKQAINNPKSVKIMTDLGNLYTKKRQWQSAIDCYRKAIEINPKYAHAHLNLARVLAKLGRQSEFIEQMEAALALKPNIVSAADCFNLGNALLKQEKPDLAIHSYYQAIAISPSLYQAYYRLGEVLNEQGKYERAAQVYQKLVENNREDADSYYLLGQQLEYLKQWDKAVKAYSKVLELQPRFPQASKKLNHALAEKLRLDLEAKRK